MNLTFTPSLFVKTLFNGMVPKQIAPGTAAYGQALVFVKLFTIGSLAVIAGWFSTFIVPDPIDFPYLFSILGLLATIFVFHQTGNALVSGNLFCLVVSLMLIPIILPTGGIYSEMVIWLILLPITATVIAGIWSGFVWMVLLIGYLLVLANIELNPAFLYNVLVVEFEAENHLVKYLIYFTILPTLFGMVSNFHGQEKKALAAENASLQAMNQKLEKDMERLQIQVHSQQLQLIELESINAHLETSNNALKEYNEELESYDYSVAHDLKEPLRTIRFFSNRLQELLEKSGIQDSKILECSQWICSAGERLEGFISGFIQNTKKPTRNTEVSLEEVIQLVSQNLNALITDRCAILEWEKLPAVPGEKLALISVFQNLISNAIQCTPEGTQPIIKINGQQKDGQFAVFVNDNGKGISQAEQAIIFKQGFSSRMPDRRTQLQGLGLSISRKYAQKMGVELDLYQSQPGVGSSFRLQFQPL